MAKPVKPIPEGFHAVNPNLVVKDARKAVEYYKKAFGAKLHGEIYAMPDGRVGHADLIVGDSHVMLADEFPDMGSVAPKDGAVSASIFLYVPDADRVFKSAVDAGAKVIMPIADQFWGDRCGTVQDPFGHRWMISTHKEDLTPEQMKKRGEEFFAAHSK